MQKAEKRFDRPNKEYAVTPERLREIATGAVLRGDFLTEETQEVAYALFAYAGLLEAKAPPEATGLQAPIVKLTVGEDDSLVATMYAPGLPPGEFDLYCEPPTPGGEKVPFWEPSEPLPALANRVTELETERDALAKDNHDLRTVMIAAAEEISEHWQAHCDADGYGPSNLLRRLEIGIPSEYGYTAGAFRKLKEELAAAELAAAANLHAAQRTNLTLSVHMHCTACGGSGLLGGLPCHCREPLTKAGS